MQAVMKKKKRIRLSNIRLRERMLLIYIIGGMIPFLFATLYNSERSRKMYVEQNKKAQKEELSLLCQSISESMNVVEGVGAHITENEKVINAIFRVSEYAYKDLGEYETLNKELELMDMYEELYKEEIASMKIYVSNPNVKSGRYLSFVYRADTEKNNWYIEAVCDTKRGHWSYQYDTQGKTKVLQYAKAVTDEKGNALGVLAISLQTEKNIDRVIEREVDSMLLYLNNEIIATNIQANAQRDYLFDYLEGQTKQSASKRINYEAEEYLITYERIYSSEWEEYYTLVSVQEYRKLMAEFEKTFIVSLTTVVVGLLISVGMIVLFSFLFGTRIRRLRRQMHLVAIGEYDKVEDIEGTDEIGELYQELKQMMGDIRKLTDKVVEEQVQKEKLHTRQKEVEFKMLASQINPHFLYNTLETIRMKAKINRQPEIEELVKMLAKIMRRNIQVGDRMVTLASEIELIENYLVIQKYRFGDRIWSKVEVDASVDLDTMVIPLIMQPFVENAYVHGLESMEHDGRLLVQVKQQEGVIIIYIRDNGAGMSMYQLAKIRQRLRSDNGWEKGHIGICNVNQRIRILYGEEYGVKVDSKENEGTCITLRFPVEKEI